MSEPPGASGADPAHTVGRYGRRVGFLGLVVLLFMSLSSGAGGIEAIVAGSGPGMAMWLFVFLPFVWGLPNVLVAAEMSSAIPVEGGYYRWCRRALGPFWGFVAGWWTWTASVFENVAYPVMIAEYADVLLGGSSWRGTRVAVVLGTILVSGYLNVRGIRVVVASSAVMMALVMLPWALFVLLAVPQATRNPFVPLAGPGRTPVEGLGVGLVVAMWFFSAYSVPSTASEEYEDSRRNLPLALIVVLPLIALAYALPLAAGLAVSDDWAAWKDGSLVAVATRVGEASGGPAAGIALGTALTVGVAIGSLAIFNALLVPYSRIPLVMAEEGDFPRLLARLHPRYRTPWVSIVFNCALYAALHWLDFSDLILLSMWNSLVAYLVIDMALVALRRREPRLPRPFRIPGAAAGLAAVLAPLALITAGAIYQSARENWAAGRAHVLALGLAGLLSGPAAYALKTRLARRRGSTGGAILPRACDTPNPST